MKMYVKIVILWIEIIRTVICFTNSYGGIRMVQLRGAVVSKYNEYNREHLKKILLKESRSSIPDSSKIEEISQILRRQIDFRGEIEDKTWKVIYPIDENISIDWMIKRTDKETFLNSIPDNTIRDSLEISFKPLESHVSKLIIQRIEISYVKDVKHVKDNIRKLKIRTRGWSIKNKQMCVGRMIMYMIGIICSIFENKKDMEAVVEKRDIIMYGVYSNPVLKNFYHVPYKNDDNNRNYSITDNNIIYADDEMIVLENSWLRYEDDDIYALPVMICVNKN